MRRLLAGLIVSLLVLTLIPFPVDASDKISFDGSFSVDVPAPVEYLGIHLNLAYKVYSDDQCNLHVDVSLEGTKGWTWDYFSPPAIRKHYEMEPQEKEASLLFTPEEVQFLYGSVYAYPILEAFPDIPVVSVYELTGTDTDAGILDFLGIARLYLVMDMPAVEVSPDRPESMCEFVKHIGPENISFYAIVSAWQSFDGSANIIPFGDKEVRGLQAVVWYVMSGTGSVAATVGSFWELPYGKVVSKFKARNRMWELIKWETAFLRLDPNMEIVPVVPYYDPWMGEVLTSIVVVHNYFPTSHAVGGVIPLPTVDPEHWLAFIPAGLQPVEGEFVPREFTHNAVLPLYTVDSVNAFLAQLLMPPSQRQQWDVGFKDDAILKVDPVAGISSEEIVSTATDIDGIDYSHSLPYIYEMDASKVSGRPEYVVGYYLDPLPLPYRLDEFIAGSPYIQESYPAFAVGIASVLDMSARWSQAGLIPVYMNAEDPLMAQASAVSQSIHETAFYYGFNGLLWKRIESKVISLMLYGGDKIWGGFAAPLDNGFTPVIASIELHRKWLADYFYDVLRSGRVVSDVPGVGIVLSTASRSIAYAGVEKAGEISSISELKTASDVLRFLGLDRIVFDDGRVLAVTPDGITHDVKLDARVDLLDLGYYPMSETGSVVFANVGLSGGVFVSGTEVRVGQNSVDASFSRDDVHVDIVEPVTGKRLAVLTPEAPSASLALTGEVEFRFVRDGFENWASSVRVVMKPDPPKLEALPSVVYTPYLTVRGRSGYAGDDVYVEVWVGSEVYTASVGEDGEFSVAVSLYKGDNEVKARTCVGSLCSDFTDPVVVRYETEVPPPNLVYTGSEVLVAVSTVTVSVEVPVEGRLDVYDNDEIVFSENVSSGVYLVEVPLAYGHNVIKARVCVSDNVCSQFGGQVDIEVYRAVVEMVIGQKVYWRNGEKQIMDAAPFILPPGRTMVPLRFVATGLGFNVKWNGETREITISGVGRDGESIQIILHMPYQPDKAFTVGGRKVYPGSSKVDVIIGDKRETVDLTDYHGQNMGIPVIAGGRTYVPIRFIAEIFGADVKWVASEKKVIIRW